MAGKGQPRAFETEEIFKAKFIEYIEDCNSKDKLPNVAGFCAFNWITRETFYAQKNYYSDTYKKIQELLEDSALNANIAPAVKIFYLKNKFKDSYKDKQEIEHSGEQTVNMKSVSTDDLRKLLDE